MKRILPIGGHKTVPFFLLNGILLTLTLLPLLLVSGTEHSSPAWERNPPFTEYHFKRLGVRLSFPSTWRVDLQPYTGEEVYYTIMAAGEGTTMLVQGWKIKDLKGFIDTSLLSAPSIDAVSVLPYASGGYSGYFLAYRQHVTEKKIFVREILLRTGQGRVTRFVLIMGEELHEEEERILHRVVESFRQAVSFRPFHGQEAWDFHFL
ncbi:hypothetical protein [Thermicanus aegyptius]|uniref:hypothetical protein n=1 Tax=Thermicanus aegyptius TaxID=94009 RepID=UPI0003FB91FC|nr:hypothetical protein [Thermicanus aegyptius]